MIWLDTTATRFDVLMIFVLTLFNGFVAGWWFARMRQRIRYHERRQREAEAHLRELQGKDAN